MSDECCKKSFWESAKDTAKRIMEDPSVAPQKVQEERRAICDPCGHRTPFDTCSLCGCVIALKIKPNNMKCPIDKWVENSND